ncbi:hypothetical protein [Kitasatospora sp. NPDC004272]
MSLARKAANRAAHWKRRQEAANTIQEKAAVWIDACRMVAIQAEMAGNPKVWTELAETLQRFYADHAR